MAEPAESMAIVELLYQRLDDAAGREAKALHALEKIAAERGELRAAGDALMATARSLAYAWETESPDRVMWDKWKEAQHAVHAWMDARRGTETDERAQVTE